MRQILPSLEKLELPYLGFCYEAVANRDFNELLILNEEISAWKLTRELRDAGNSQGTQLLRMILKFTGVPFPKNLNRFCMRVEIPVSRLQQLHFLRNFQEVPLSSAMIAWIYQSVSNFCSASVKLLRLGEIACQKIIYNCINKERVRGILREL